MSRLRKRGVDNAIARALGTWAFATVGLTIDRGGYPVRFALPWGKAFVYGFFAGLVVFIVSVLFPDKPQTPPDPPEERSSTSS